jgi:hypothetical protein
MLTDEHARQCLAQEWGLPCAALTRLDGGMGSRTWAVDDAGRRWVLKSVAPALGGNRYFPCYRTAVAGSDAGRPKRSKSDASKVVISAIMPPPVRSTSSLNGR